MSWRLRPARSRCQSSHVFFREAHNRSPILLAVAPGSVPVWDVALERCPAEWAALISKVISGLSVGHDHSGDGRAQDFGGAREPQRKVRERGGDERPNPRLRGPLLERRFVAMNDDCQRNGGGDFVVTNGPCDGRSRLLLDDPRGTARPAEQDVESWRGAYLRTGATGPSRRPSRRAASAPTCVRERSREAPHTS